MQPQQPNNVKIKIIKKKDGGVNKKESQLSRQRREERWVGADNSCEMEA